jgi:hypothetical protein
VLRRYVVESDVLDAQEVLSGGGGAEKGLEKVSLFSVFQAISEEEMSGAIS